MKMEFTDGVLRLSAIKELEGVELVCRQALEDLPGPLEAIEVDLSQTELLDSGGLGELIALQKMAVRKCGKALVRVANPPPQMEQLLELTRLYKVFPVLKR